MKFSDIPRYTQFGNYRIDVDWNYFPSILKRYFSYGLNLYPDFQRGHIWTEEQQIKYIEFKLAGGGMQDCICFNCVGWRDSYKGPFVIVDGLQRITAVSKFINNKITAYGYYYKDFEDRLRSTDCSLQFCINNLETRREVLKWYLEMNSGGTPHTKEEIERVERLLNNEEYLSKGE